MLAFVVTFSVQLVFATVSVQASRCSGSMIDTLTWRCRSGVWRDRRRVGRRAARGDGLLDGNTANVYAAGGASC